MLSFQLEVGEVKCTKLSSIFLQDPSLASCPGKQKKNKTCFRTPLCLLKSWILGVSVQHLGALSISSSIFIWSVCPLSDGGVLSNQMFLRNRGFACGCMYPKFCAFSFGSGSSTASPPSPAKSPSGWQPKVTPVVSGADLNQDPLLLQRDLLRGYIEQARQANRFDEVEALTSSLRDIELEISRSRR